ncbi:MAG TPA: ABC transporter substrate-binding protein [Chloroflexota bacterium]|nr:ABC transporter substrate-binding protein [Chloroflexota bacterium]
MRILSRDQHWRRIARYTCSTALVAGLLLPGARAASTASAHSRASAGSVDSGTLTLTENGLAADIDPANNESEYGDTVERNIDETLVRLAGSTLNSFEPDLATSWSSNANKSIWTFHLRHGVKFHDGRCCMTATDVQYSLGRSAAAGLGGAYMLDRFLSATDPFKQIKIIDPYTVEFDLGVSQPTFIAAMAQDYNALILDSKAVKAHATKADPYAHTWVALPTHDVGTGPYMEQSWTASQQMVLTRFPGYWGGWSGRHFGKVIISEVDDPATRRELMEKGQADITFDLTPSDYDALKQNPKVRVVAPYGTEVFYVAMNPYGPLASPLARQAMSYAFDYNALINGIMKGYAQRAVGPISSETTGYDPHAFMYQTDLTKAKQLLQQAGVPAGTTLTYEYDDVFPNGAIGEILQAQLAQLGITLQLKQLDTAAYTNIIYGNEKPADRPSFMPYQWWEDYNDPYNAADTLVDSAQSVPAGSNLGQYHNKQVDATLAKMRYADQATVIKYAKVLQNLTGQVDPPAIWVAQPAQTTVLASSLHGFVFNPIELRTFYFYEMFR